MSFSFFKKHREPLIEVALSLAVFLVSFLTVFLFARIDFDAHHTGLMYKTALDVAHGKIIFRDTFTQYGALTSLFQAAAILMLGEKITSILCSTAFFYALSFGLFYVISRRFLSRGFSLFTVALTLGLAPFLIWTFHPWSSVYSLFFMLLALYFALKAMDIHPRLFSALAGASATFAFWCRQPVGYVSLIALLLLPLLFALFFKNEPEKRKQLLLLPLFPLAGAALAFFSTFLPLLALGAGKDFYRQCIEGSLIFAASRNYAGGFIGTVLERLFVSPLTKWNGAFLDFIWLLLPLSSLFLFILSTVRLRHAQKAGDTRRFKPLSALIVFSVFAVAAWHQYYPVGCYRHWFWGAFPSVLSMVFLLRDLIGNSRRFHVPYLKTMTLVLSFLLLFSPAVGFRVAVGASKLHTADDHVLYQNEYYPHLNGLYLRPAVADYYNDLFSTMSTLQKTFPETNVVNTTENGIFAVFGENFCPLFNNAGDFYYKEYPELLKNYIEKDAPIVIGPKAPNETYVLYHTVLGDPDDPYADSHRMPANIYLPRTLKEQLDRKETP